MIATGCLVLVAGLSLASAGSSNNGPAAVGSAVATADSAVRLAELIRGVLLPGWSLQHDSATIRVFGEVTTQPPSAPSDATEHHTYDVVLTMLPALSDEAQRQQVARAERLERRLWRSVARLECDGKEFSDHYIDGLCFRTKTNAQRRRVEAYRHARTALLDVPRHRFGADLAVSVRVHGPEPTDGTCSDCNETAQRIKALLSPYPEQPASASSSTPAHR